MEQKTHGSASAKREWDTIQQGARSVGSATIFREMVFEKSSAIAAGNNLETIPGKV
jgi:hypothetical protein